MASIAARSSGRSRSNLLLLLAALALGAITAMLVVNYLSQQDEERRNLTDASVTVVVASKDIPIGTNITSSMLEAKRVTPDVAVASAFEEPAQIVGLRARSTITAGAQVVPGMVVQSGAGDALSFVVPPGKRAVAITGSNVIGGGGHIRPGDYVDVLVTIESWKLNGSQVAPSSNEKPKGVVTILQNIEVLAVSNAAQKVSESGPDSKDKKATTDKSLDSADNKSVTLAVDPSQAQLLFLAESEGKVRLALRPFGEQDTPQIPPVIEPLMPASAAAPTTR